MKISLIFNIILCVFVILYIGEFEMTTKPFRVRLIHWDRAVGKQFSNLTPGSEHDIVPPPPGQDNKRGEWVMGVGEPVLLLAGEYVYCKNEKES